MLKLINYIKHFLTATNQHGVHSPFVYDYLTKCIYKRQSRKTSKSVNVLFKSIPYFKVKSIQVLPKDSTIKNQLQQFSGLQLNQNPPFDFIYLQNPSEIEKINPNQLHNDSVILVNDIHKNKINHRSWEALKNRNEYTVSIDFFYCGILCVRREQVKEHFRIRI